MQLEWSRPQRGVDCGIAFRGAWRPGWKIHGEEIAFTPDRQIASLGSKDNLLLGRVAVLEDDMGAREGGVATEIHLDLGSEPAKIEGITAGNDERGLGVVVLQRDGLQDRIGEPLVHDHDGCRVPGEHAAREGVDLKDR